MSHKTIRRKSGFTLIELLVVVAIIALLAAILFPVFSSARESSRAAACISNLKQIGLAFTMYEQDDDEYFPTDYFSSFSPGQSTPGAGYSGVFGNGRWPWRIGSYVKDTQIYQCPSGQAYSTVEAGTPDADLMSYWAVGGMFGKPGTVDAIPIAMSGVQSPSTQPTLFDDIDQPTGWRDQLVFRPYWIAGTYGNVGSFTPGRVGPHSNGLNVLYADGHAKWQNVSTLYLQACPGYTNVNSTCTPPY